MVFNALQMVIVDSLKIGTAAGKCDVNHQTVKSLKPRVERCESYAKKLNELMLQSGTDKQKGNTMRLNKAGTGGDGDTKPPPPTKP